MEREFWKFSQTSFSLPVVVKTYLNSCKKQWLNREKLFPYLITQLGESLCIDKHFFSENSIYFLWNLVL